VADPPLAKNHSTGNKVYCLCKDECFKPPEFSLFLVVRQDTEGRSRLSVTEIEGKNSCVIYENRKEDSSCCPRP